MGVGDAAKILGGGAFAPEIERACYDWGVDTPEEQARFLAQVTTETAQYTRLSESFNYSVQGLRATFSKARISDDECAQWGRRQGKPADQTSIANRVYGGLWGRNRLGNTEPGDGWKYRGRGLPQLTGRDNYAACGHALNLDLIAHPELMLQPRIAAQAAGWFWKNRGCEGAKDIIEVSRRWNGGLNAIDERVHTYAHAKKLLGIA